MPVPGKVRRFGYLEVLQRFLLRLFRIRIWFRSLLIRLFGGLQAILIRKIRWLGLIFLILLTP
jgi:hypothetical protein